MKFGAKIKKARLDAGLTQEQLGIKCGWTNGNPQSRVGNYEKDTRAPSAADLLAISNALGINILYFYGQEDPYQLALAPNTKFVGESAGTYPLPPKKLDVEEINLLREIILQCEKIQLEESLNLSASQRAAVIAAGFAASVAQNLTAKDISTTPDVVLTAIYTAIQPSSA